MAMLARDSMSRTARRAWSAAYWVLTIIFVVTAFLGIQRIPAGFLTNHAADLACPAWLYIGLRGLHGTRGPSTLGRLFASTPERAAVVLFGGSTLTELSQIWWPHGLFSGTFDPYDILSYAIGVGACYAFEKISVSQASPAG
jgi:hypothetical protein